MKKTIINKLINEFDIIDVEKNIIYDFLSINKIDYSDSTLLKDYFNGFKKDSILIKKIKKSELNNFQDLEYAMELLIPASDRGLNGAYFTPRFIVDYIINGTSPKETEKIIDPSCGCGAFLLGILRYFEKNGKSINSIVKENIYGADILDYNIRRTKILITIYGLQKGEIVLESSFNLNVLDSLRTNWNQSFDVVLGNPPYVKYQDLSIENREYLKQNWDTIDKGTFNIYFAFFELGYNLLSNSGRLGYITPNNYFTSLAGESLRRYFEEKGSISKIIDFHHHKIFDAQTYTCITFLEKKYNNTILFDRLYSDQVNDFLLNNDLTTIPIADLETKKWRLLREKERSNVKKIESSGTTLGELFVINVGIATLRDTIFFIDSTLEDGDYYIKNCGDRIFKVEKDLVKSIYKISDFVTQNNIKQNKRKIIFPYDINNNKAVVIQEDEFMKRFPKGYEYLLAMKKELDSRGKQPVTPFYMYGRSQGLNKFGIRLLTPTFSQKPKFLFVNETESLYCNGYGLHYKDDFNGRISLFDDEPIQKKENIDVLQRILNSNIMHYYVSHTSVSIQGGYPCYQKNFIERFTIPSFSQDEISISRNLNEYEFEEMLIDKYNLKDFDCII